MNTNYMRGCGFVAVATRKPRPNVELETDGLKLQGGWVRLDMTKDLPQGTLKRAGHTLQVMIDTPKNQHAATEAHTLLIDDKTKARRLGDSFLLLPRGLSKGSDWDPPPAGARMYDMVGSTTAAHPMRLRLTYEFDQLLRTHPELHFLRDGKVHMPQRCFDVLVADFPQLEGRYDAPSSMLDVTPAELRPMLLMHPELYRHSNMFHASYSLALLSREAMRLGFVKEGEVIGAGIMGPGAAVVHVKRKG